MTAAEFRVALEELEMSQAGFARLLRDLGHSADDTARSVRRWAHKGTPPEVPVIINLLQRQAL